MRNRRGQPIVLSETSSLDLESRTRLQRSHWHLERPAPMPDPLGRAEVDPEPVPWFDEPEPDASADAPPRRSLRLMAPPSSNRRRWSVEFSRRGDDV